VCIVIDPLYCSRPSRISGILCAVGGVFYPFACSVVALYDTGNDIGRVKNEISVIPGIIFFNPPLMVIIVGIALWFITFG
jgi:hypothetical protein